MDDSEPPATDAGASRWIAPAPPEEFDAASLILPSRGHNGLPHVHWRTGDLIAGLLFLAVWRGGVLVLQAYRDATPPWVLLVVGTAIPIFVIGLFPVWAYVRGGRGWPVRRPSSARWIVEIALAVPVLVVLLVSVNLLSAFWERQGGIPQRLDPRMHEIAFSGNPYLLAIMAAGACLWAPLAEELFFRGFLQNALAQRLPKAVAALLQAAAFAVVHPYGGLQLAAIGVISGGLTLHYLWRKTLIATMALHAILNGLMMLVVGGMMFAASHSGVLGVRLDESAERCRIADVAPGGGAAAAGLQAGDVIVALDDESIADWRTLQLHMLGKPPGASVRITFEREGRTHRAAIILAPRGKFTPVPPEAPDAAR